MALKSTLTGAEELARATSSFRHLLQKAIRSASPSDAQAIQRLSSGLGVLTKAVSVLDELKAKEPQLATNDFLHQEYDNMGNRIVWPPPSKR